MKVSQEFGKFWRAEDIDRPLTLTIAGAAIELLGEEKERNLVVAFEEDSRRLVAKPTRRRQLVNLFGDDTAAWIGQQVELYTDLVWFGNKEVPSIQCGSPNRPEHKSRIRRRPPTPEEVAVAAQAPISDDDADPIS
jgi:hypothetical protein